MVQKCRSISVLPIYGKIFVSLKFNSLFNYFMPNKRFTEYQAGFIPGESCVAK